MKNVSNKNASLKKGVPVKGGNGKMVGKQTAGAQKPGVSSQEKGSSPSMPKGGNTKMFGKQTAGKVKPGTGSPV